MVIKLSLVGIAFSILLICILGYNKKYKGNTLAIILLCICICGISFILGYWNGKDEVFGMIKERYPEVSNKIECKNDSL